MKQPSRRRTGINTTIKADIQLRRHRSGDDIRSSAISIKSTCEAGLRSAVYFDKQVMELKEHIEGRIPNAPYALPQQGSFDLMSSPDTKALYKKKEDK